MYRIRYRRRGVCLYFGIPVDEGNTDCRDIQAAWIFEAGHPVKGNFSRGSAKDVQGSPSFPDRVARGRRNIPRGFSDADLDRMDCECRMHPSRVEAIVHPFTTRGLPVCFGLVLSPCVQRSQVLRAEEGSRTTTSRSADVPSMSGSCHRVVETGEAEGRGLRMLTTPGSRYPSHWKPSDACNV